MHLVQQVCVKLMPVLCQADDPLGKGLNVDEVDRADVLAHAGLGSLQNVVGLVLVTDNLHHLGKLHKSKKGAGYFTHPGLDCLEALLTSLW